MPASTRASRANKAREEDDDAAEGDDAAAAAQDLLFLPARDHAQEEASGEEMAPKPIAEKNKSGGSGRKNQRRKEKEAELRSRNLGVGMKISIDDARGGSTNKKITFGEDEEFVFNERESGKRRGGGGEAEAKGSGDDGSDDDDDDDDAVEEVKSGTAREGALRQREAERTTAREEAVLHKKKKRKRRVEKIPLEDDDEDSDDDELDEEFLAMVDSERQSDRVLQKLRKRAEKRRKLEGKKKLGRHTTFVSDGGDRGASDVPIEADHNIEVVVLPSRGTGGKDRDDNGGTSCGDLSGLHDISSVHLGTEPSKAAMVFSRCRLSGGDVERRGKKKGGKVKKKGGRPAAKMEGWKRSRKMTHVQGRSRPAANFVRRK